MTHVYSFALITSFLLASTISHILKKTKWFGIFLFLLSLIILIRRQMFPGASSHSIRGRQQAAAKRYITEAVRP